MSSTKILDFFKSSIYEIMLFISSSVAFSFFDTSLFARLMGLDGYILTAFILGIPANEIVLPIILMCYLKTKSLTNIEDTFAVGEILKQNGWNILTAINVMLFTVFHFPSIQTDDPFINLWKVLLNNNLDLQDER